MTTPTSGNRTRTKDPRTVYTDSIQERVWYQGTLNPSGSTSVYGPILTDQYAESMEDVVTPNYANLRARGHIINNWMKQERVDLTYNPGMVDWEMHYRNDDGLFGYRTYIGQNIPHYMNVDGETYPPTEPGFIAHTILPIEEMMEMRALTKAYAKIEETDANIYATLGEAGKTAASVASIFIRLKLLASEFKTAMSRIKNVAGSAYLLSKLWLEYRYAIRPLCFEVMGIIEALESGKPLRVRLSSSLTHEEDYKVSLPPRETAQYTLTRQDHMQRTIKVSAGVLVSYHVEKMNLNQRLGSNQPLLGAWELIPYSFIIDWFLSVGEWLQAMTPKANVTVLSNWLIREVETIETRRCLDFTVKSGYMAGEYDIVGKLNSFSPSSITIKHKVKTRTPNVPMPAVPSLNVRLDLLKGLDLVAIFADLRGVDRVLRKTLRGIKSA